MATRKSEVKEPLVVKSEPMNVSPKRVMKGFEKIHHDLYKLEVADLKKNLGTARSPRWDNAAHVHYYHSVDSNGRPQTHCSAIGGHKHEVKTYTAPDGTMRAECGPPVRDKKQSRGEVPSNDNHTHEVSYVVSQEVEKRKRNEEAAKALNNLMSQPKPLQY